MLLITSALFINGAAFSQTRADAIIGNWQLKDGSKKINVDKENGRYVGKIYWVKDPGRKAEIGKKVLWDFEYDVDDKEWNGGEIKLPDMAHAASCYIKLIDSNTVAVTGYHGIRLLGKTKTLTRAN